MLPLRVLPPIKLHESFDNIISGISLLVCVVSLTILSVKPLFIKKLHDLIYIDSTEILRVNVAIIALVLFFSFVEGFDGSKEAQVTFITANIVFHFTLSAIIALTMINNLSIRSTVAGFMNLILAAVLLNNIPARFCHKDIR